MREARYKDASRYVTLVTFNDEKPPLVHAVLFATFEPPHLRKKSLHYIHLACRKPAPRGTYKHLGMESRRFPTCLYCVAWVDYRARR